jgi:hypothetical protein
MNINIFDNEIRLLNPKLTQISDIFSDYCKQLYTIDKYDTYDDLNQQKNLLNDSNYMILEITESEIQSKEVVTSESSESDSCDLSHEENDNQTSQKRNSKRNIKKLSNSGSITFNIRSIHTPEFSNFDLDLDYEQEIKKKLPSGQQSILSYVKKIRKIN